MNYLIKSHLQNILAMMPKCIGDNIYYAIQRTFGSLRHLNSSQYVENAKRITDACAKIGFQIDGKKLFELGTGRTISTPIAMILEGADSVLTVDANRYLRTNLSFQSAGDVLRKYKKDSCKNDFYRYESGFAKIAGANGLMTKDVKKLLDLFNIVYRAPFDARETGITSKSVDLYFSTNVIEHVPINEIVGLFKEAKRIVTPDGLMAHYIDLRDHFAATDETITNVNFLKYSTDHWERIAGNRLMYQNRLRYSDYRKLFAELNFIPLWVDTEIDERSLIALRQGFKVDPIFREYDFIDLSTVGLTVIGRFAG